MITNGYVKTEPAERQRDAKNRKQRATRADARRAEAIAREEDAEARKAARTPTRQSQINAHIPEAERRADSVIKVRGSACGGEGRSAMWNRVFAQEMDILCKAAGLRV